MELNHLGLHCYPFASSPPSKDVSVLENSCKGCKYFVNWRNASVNGNKLTLEGLQRLRDLTIPTSGSLRIDYVTYKVWNYAAVWKAGVRIYISRARRVPLSLCFNA